MSEGGIISRGIAGCQESPFSVLLQKEEKRKRHQARRLLAKASVAGRLGKLQRCDDLRRQAEELVGAEEAAVLCEEERFSFSPAPSLEIAPRRPRHGFAI